MSDNYLSIVLCTYNGDSFLRDQLESIKNQTRQPDELIVCDDCSIDRTLDILFRFQREISYPVRIYNNEVSLGISKNYEKAISLCNGEIIALCDQDDIWSIDKLKILEEKLEQNKGSGYVFSNADLVDQELKPSKTTQWEQLSFNIRRQKKFMNKNQVKVLLKENIVTGATMAFRSQLMDLILPIPDIWIHDGWIALLGSGSNSRGVFVEDSLIKYRQHYSQAIGSKNRSLLHLIQVTLKTRAEAYELDIQKIKMILERLEEKNQLDDETKHLLEMKIAHLNTRSTIHKNPLRSCGGSYIQEIISGRYFIFSYGLKSILKDFLFIWFA